MSNLLHDQIAEFIEDKHAKRSPATADQYSFVLLKVLQPWADSVGITEADQIDAKAMDRFTAHLKGRAKPLSPATIRTYIRATRIFLTYFDVAKGRYEAPRSPQRLRDVLSRTEIDAMERAATDERDRIVIRLLGDTGIRASELLGLRGEDLREDSHNRQYFVRVVGKGNKERQIAISGSFYRRLRNHADYNPEYLFNGKRRRNGQTERLTTSGLNQLVHHTARRAGIKRRVWPHLFRHSYTSHMLVQGINLVVLQKTLGHESLSMISQVYSHLNPTDTYADLMKALRA